MHFDFDLKGYIYCKDGEHGKLAAVVTDPEVRQVTDLIVKQGHLLPQQRLVPIVVVQSALGEDIYLSSNSYELDQYPEYRVTEYKEPVTEMGERTVEIAAPFGLQGSSKPIVPTRKQKIREGITSSQKVIELGMPVHNVEGKIGKAGRVVVNRERNEIAYLVVRRGLIFPEQLVIPITMIEGVSEDSVQVTGTDDALKHLSRYEHAVETDFLTK